jgi:glycosyltransferase involved in cell wall biosynthesis
MLRQRVMVACHQFVPALEPGAIGSHTLEVQRTLLGAGIECEVFTQIIHPSMQGRGRLYTDYGGEFPGRRDDCLMYQFGIGSVVAAFLRGRPERKALDYHNITPPHMLAAWEPEMVPGLRWGTRQLLELSANVDFALADSTFNREDLRALGYRDVEVVPILLDLAAFDIESDPATLQRLQRDRSHGGADLLFVGRIVPNKCQHQLIKALVVYRQTCDPNARLRLVGGTTSPSYLRVLHDFANALGVADAVDFAGPVSAAQLSAYYRTADVFVSASEHEGFCVPLLEAMHHGIPIVALAAAAVPETLAGAGVLVDSSAPALLAAAIKRVVSRPDLRATIVEAGTRRLRDFDLEVTRQRLLEVLAAHGVVATR